MPVSFPLFAPSHRSAWFPDFKIFLPSGLHKTFSFFLLLSSPAPAPFPLGNTIPFEMPDLISGLIVFLHYSQFLTSEGLICHISCCAPQLLDITWHNKLSEHLSE